MEDKIIVFKNNKIRRIWFENEWWFSTVDVVLALTGINEPRDYIEKPKTMPKHKKVAKRGGNVAGKARKHTEKEIGMSVISHRNFLNNVKRYKKLAL